MKKNILASTLALSCSLAIIASAAPAAEAPVSADSVGMSVSIPDWAPPARVADLAGRLCKAAYQNALLAVHTGSGPLGADNLSASPDGDSGGFIASMELSWVGSSGPGAARGSCFVSRAGSVLSVASMSVAKPVAAR